MRLTRIRTIGQLSLFQQESCQPSAFSHQPAESNPPSAIRDPQSSPHPILPLHACVLGSGSGGNCTVIRCGERAFLIDAGFGPQVTHRRLQQLGLGVPRIEAVCVTHLDQDHFRPTWVRTLVAHRIRVYLHRWHRRHLDRVPGAEDLYRAELVHFFETESFSPVDVPGLSISTVRLPHDDKGTSAFHVCAPGARMGYATDLGHAPPELIEAFAGVDVLMLESNYDPQMQLTSSRPVYLKKRIMGDHGHLSNEQALDVCRRIADRSPRGNPQRIVLLHRSAQCNTAELVKRTFEEDERFIGRIVLAQQRRRTPWIPIAPLEATSREQIAMFT